MSDRPAQAGPTPDRPAPDGSERPAPVDFARMDKTAMTPADLETEFEAGPATPPATAAAGEPPVPPSSSSLVGSGGRFGDRFFFGMATGASTLIVVTVVLIAVFLLSQSIPSITNDKVNFLTSFNWSTNPGDLQFGVARLLWATVIISILAMIIAVPLSVGIALFITQYAPRRIAKPAAHVVDLLAAIPSIIYGLWGASVLAPELTPVQTFLNHLDFIPLFTAGNATGTLFDGGVVLAIMILPIVTAISRDVFERTPPEHVEAAMALGATRWESVRMTVLPYGRPGVISGSMLGLGRALGETIAILIIVNSTSSTSNSLFNGGQTIASKIANDLGEFGLHPGPYIAAGLVLFVLTFVVNALARFAVSRRKEFS